jgi:hypothetical protein
MPRSIQAAALATLTVVACAQTSQAPPTTTAPVVSASAAADPVIVAAAPAASIPAATPVPAPVASATTEPASAGDPDTEVGAQFRACKSDADCLAVPRAGCCDNGWKVPVAASQKDAYAQANACTRKRPMCPMFKVRDRRVAYCDPQAHQCALWQP